MEAHEVVKFYLGIHQPQWLDDTSVPLFVSRRTLYKRKTFPRAAGRWALDSGGFTELTHFGEWTVSAKQYVSEVRRFQQEIGGLDWASPQDWMCEPFVTAKTGLSVAEHQRRTIQNYIELRCLAPEIPFIPVLQGWSERDYLVHIDDYFAAGIDLRQVPLVGVGSVCRRQNTAQAERIIRHVASMGIHPHGFGFKLTGIRAAHDALASADSMAWSFGARRSDPLAGCSHRNCANCLRYALRWREKVVRAMNFPISPPLFLLPS